MSKGFNKCRDGVQPSDTSPAAAIDSSALELSKNQLLAVIQSSCLVLRRILDPFPQLNVSSAACKSESALWPDYSGLFLTPNEGREK